MLIPKEETSRLTLTERLREERTHDHVIGVRLEESPYRQRRECQTDFSDKGVTAINFNRSRVIHRITLFTGELILKLNTKKFISRRPGSHATRIHPLPTRIFS